MADEPERKGGAEDEDRSPAKAAPARPILGMSEAERATSPTAATAPITRT